MRSDSDTATGVSDAGLLSQIAAGDQQALAWLYQRHGRVVLAQISLLTGDWAASEEILQDAMLAVWRGAGSFRGRAELAGGGRRAGHPGRNREEPAGGGAHSAGPPAGGERGTTMNTSTEQHLDMEEMLAEVTGGPLSERARDHLASCPDCRSGAAGWGAASAGVQLLVAATELPPWQFLAGATGHRPRRRTLITAAASVAVLAAAGGTTRGLTSGGTPARPTSPR